MPRPELETAGPFVPKQATLLDGPLLSASGFAVRVSPVSFFPNAASDIISDSEVSGRSIYLRSPFFLTLISVRAPARATLGAVRPDAGDPSDRLPLSTGICGPRDFRKCYLFQKISDFHHRTVRVHSPFRYMKYSKMV